MKAILLLASLLTARAAAADTTNTIKSLSVTNSVGDVFRNLTLEKATEDGLMFSCKAGLVKAKWEQLPDWCREKYGTAGEEQSAKDLEEGLVSAKLAAQKDAYDAGVNKLEAEARKTQAVQAEKDRKLALVAAIKAREQAVKDEEQRRIQETAARSANAPQHFISGGPAKRK